MFAVCVCVFVYGFIIIFVCWQIFTTQCACVRVWVFNFFYVFFVAFFSLLFLGNNSWQENMSEIKIVQMPAQMYSRMYVCMYVHMDVSTFICSHSMVILRCTFLLWKHFLYANANANVNTMQDNNNRLKEIELTGNLKSQY